MSLGGARRQMSRPLALPLEARGEAPQGQRSGDARTATRGHGGSGTDRLMERVGERGNVTAALKRVRQNQGSPGADGMPVHERPTYRAEHGEVLRAQLRAGTSPPKPGREVAIPKSGGGMRELGIPCALDRFLQQAILQVLQPRFDPTFSEHSYGFRPGRRAHDAVSAAQRYIQDGRRWVVEVDLAKFFDRVNHDMLMGKLAKRIEDKRVLGLIRRYLAAGVMLHGVVMERYEGTPPGGPLSPLLATVLLDDVDKALEKHGLSFVRSADDLNISVRSRRAGEEAMQTLRRLYARLRLRINEAKSAVAKPWDRTFLGYSFWVAPGRVGKRRVAPTALEARKERVRVLTNRNGGRSRESMLAALRRDLAGGKEYVRLADTPRIVEQLDEWICRRVRMVQLQPWRRGTTAYRARRARGVPEPTARGAAAHVRRWWHVATHAALKIALPMSDVDAQGVPRLAASPPPAEPPDTDPYVRWCGRGTAGLIPAVP
ncbi:MAG: group II intron reverse transcriptase/maturase [Nitrospirales bacterium]